jgi:hypothetical protein
MNELWSKRPWNPRQSGAQRTTCVIPSGLLPRADGSFHGVTSIAKCYSAESSTAVSSRFTFECSDG